jgi:hypothetical protein
MIFVDTVNASEINDDAVKTLGLNLLVPGLGFYVIMDDLASAVTIFGLYGVGITAFIYYDKFYEGEKTGANVFKFTMFTSVILIPAITCNIVCPFTEYKSKSENSSYHKNEGLNMAILPNNHGNFKAYLLYNKAF